MASKEEITESIKARFSNVRDRARILGQALKVRADIAVVRRRLRSAYADLGEEVHGRMETEPDGPWGAEEDLQEYRVRIDGVKTEVKQRERALANVLAGTPDGEIGDAVEKDQPAAADSDDKQEQA